MPPHNPSTSDTLPGFTLNDVPTTIKNELARKTHDFAVHFIRDDKPAGSGVFVKVAEYYGILTAEHVIYPPEPPFDDSENSRQTLTFPLKIYCGDPPPEHKTFQDSLPIPMNHLRWYP